MRIRSGSSEASRRGTSELFTGRVWIDYLHNPAFPARTQIQQVTFEPGSRTVWHTHPFGQVLIVTAGRGWVQSDGGPVTEIRPGDVVSIEPNEKHWHGATRDHVLSFLAIQEERDGKVVDPMEPVPDDQYGIGVLGRP